MLWLAKKTGKAGYIEQGQVVRMVDEGTLTREVDGPGIAWAELDAALHRAVAVWTT
ncbi:hypothetical protein AB0407_37255 [Streptomyces microflavus]|uniref:hypothetical protein n=1 Tax=Streptomyces microflavus TaxID=1919 RepID=UPI00345098F5